MRCHDDLVTSIVSSQLCLVESLRVEALDARAEAFALDAADALLDAAADAAIDEAVDAARAPPPPPPPPHKQQLPVAAAAALPPPRSSFAWGEAAAAAAEVDDAEAGAAAPNGKEATAMLELPKVILVQSHTFAYRRALPNPSSI